MMDALCAARCGHIQLWQAVPSSRDGASCSLCKAGPSLPLTRDRTLDYVTRACAPLVHTFYTWCPRARHAGPPRNMIRSLIFQPGSPINQTRPFPASGQGLGTRLGLPSQFISPYNNQAFRYDSTNMYHR